MDQLRRRIERALRERGLKPRSASVAAGVHADAVRRILSEPQHRPSPQTCRRLADYFGWDVDEVLALAGHRPAGASAELEPLSLLETALLAGMKRRGWRSAVVEAVQSLLMAEDAVSHVNGPNPDNEVLVRHNANSLLITQVS